MSARLRSSSVGSRPRPRLQRPSRSESAQAVALDVRCACQFYETKSLLPERVNPVGYNTADDFEPCVHVRARFKDQHESTAIEQNTPNMNMPIASINVPIANALPNPPQTNYDIPPEFAPENVVTNNFVIDQQVLGNRSVSYTNMGAVQPQTQQFIKQRDPSTSSLLRKRMSEERQPFTTLNKRMSQSSITQKDPSQSTILRRKMFNRSSASFDRASSEMVSNERIQQPFQFQQTRIPNERTFYHDSNEIIRNSNMEIADTQIEVAPSRDIAAAAVTSPKTEIASPLSMQSQGNRRFILSSTENLPQKPDLYAKRSVETEPDSGIDSNFVEDIPRKTDIEKQFMKNDQRVANQNVCDEEKVLMLTKSQNVEQKPLPKLVAVSVDDDTNDGKTFKPKPIPTHQSLQLMKVEDVETVEMPTQSSKLQIQYLAKFDSTLRSQEAETNEYSYSKIFDNYKSAQTTPSQSRNVSTLDLRTTHIASNYIRQRDPSCSPFLQNRYRTPTPTQKQAVEMELKKNHDKLLPPAGDLPERRASEVAPPQMNQQIEPQYIRQKDMRTSNILNRRRRNLSQTSFDHDSGISDLGQPLKVTKTIGFENNLSQIDSDHISPHAANTKISKGVSFNKSLPTDRLDFSNTSTNRRPFRDHEYEPIGEPIPNTKPEQSFDRPVFTITEPESPTTDENPKPDIVHEERISYDGSESPIRSITPFTDVSRTEDIHTSQIDDSVIEELPLRREDRKKKSFMTNAGETTKNLQNKISSQASNLRTKFKRSLKSSNGSGSQKTSGSNLKSSLKSSPKTSQTSPKERKRFKRIDFANKIKSIHMPKMSKPELPKFKMPEKFKLSSRNDTQPDMSADEPTTMTVDETCGPSEDAPTVVSVTTEEIFESKTVGSKKRFEFGSYPKIFNRFKQPQQQQSTADDHDVTDFVSESTATERDTATQPSSSSFSTHFATVPRTASKIKNSIISKWNKSSFSKSSDRGDDSESIPQGSIPHHDESHEDSVERRIRLASKISMEDEEEPLGILQTKEQIQLASYDEENRAIHQISRAREQEFKARKPPLVHQDSDLISDESNRDIDWEECERMRNKIMGIKQHAPTFEFEADEPKRDAHGRRIRTDSNFSTEETQSSGSSGDRRRTGVIEDIDDDEFFLRQRGVSQDNAEISKYISSAIREGHASYSYDNNADDFTDEYHHFTEQPSKPLRRRHDGYNRNFESYDDYRHDNLSDHEIPVATQYFPRHDDENLSFYDNEFVDDLDHPNILSRDEHFDSDIDNDREFRPSDAKPQVPKRRRKGRIPPKQDSIETNEEVLVYRSEPSFTVPIDEQADASFIVKPRRKNRSISSKSDPAPENQEVQFDGETEILEKYSPNNSRYTIDIKETNGYATVKKEPPARPPAPTRRKRSTKSLGDTLQADSSRAMFKDSPFPERQKRSFNISAPARPPRRGSSSSLIDQHKPPSIAPSDGTQYEEIDDELNDEDNEFYPPKIQNRPLPPPPRPPRDKRQRRKSNIDRKFDDNDDDAEQVAVVGSFDDSEFSTREFVGAEMATQTSLDIDDLYLNEDVPLDHETAEQYSRTVEEILRSSDTQQQQPHDHSTRTSDDNLSKGIQKFRESNQRSYSERSRASTERQSSRPITPSALIIEQRITRSPVQMDATLIMHPIDQDSSPPKKIDYRTDSAESEYVPYADDVDDTHLDTEDERIINAAIQRYQMLGNEIDSSLARESTPKAIDENKQQDIVEKSTIEVPQPPPRRKSSANASQITETITVPLAEAETLSIASTHDLNQFTPEPVNDLSSESAEPTHAQVDSLTVVNIQSDDTTTVPIAKSETKPIVNSLQITPEVMQEIIERVRETLPIQSSASQSEPQTASQTTPPPSPQESEPKVTPTETETNEKVTDEKKEKSDNTPKRPQTPTEYTPTTEIPASFYQLRTGISEDESSLPPSAIPAKHRSRKHTRRAESSSDEECSRRHHHSHHGGGAVARTNGQDLTIADLSGQLIRACGRALSSSLNTAGHSLVDFLRGLTKNQDDQQKDLSLVLVILIIIVASLMMLGISGDRSVHHHHWDYFNPPDNLGRR
ncbi:uncharacterized protein LOC116351986 isoform X3 [Contarinia nasturtii]|uniref:uncharacterized protein LOC116351986 isoform X3 n=1 Tax=Contarinia nasturtii TaxID=265458 RepID=UPI0012D49CC8|nr:uncharacterized protein LOC116351986 isoform X3 [Contarinia nasturtii]